MLQARSAAAPRHAGAAAARRAARAARIPRAVTLRVRAVIAVGDQLPSFELISDENRTIKSQDMVKDKGCVIFIYPRANTSGCTCQANGFKDNLPTFKEKGYDVYGLSADTPEAQAAWKAQEGLNFPLLCDPDFTVLPTLCGSKKGGKVTRTHLVVEKGGRISEVKLAVGSKDSVPEALKFVQEQAL